MEAVQNHISKETPCDALNTFDDTVVSKNRETNSGELWKCFYCNLEEHYDYKGNKPPFAKHITFLEDCYIMKDPFSSLNRGEILVLGADCEICEKSVCLNCSLYFSKRFCKDCTLKNFKHFPLKLQQKIRHIFQLKDEEEM